MSNRFNWYRGSYRLWVVLSVLWILLCGAGAIYVTREQLQFEKRVAIARASNPEAANHGRLLLTSNGDVCRDWFSENAPTPKPWERDWSAPQLPPGAKLITPADRGIDYNALAKKYGAISSVPPNGPGFGECTINPRGPHSHAELGYVWLGVFAVPAGFYGILLAAAWILRGFARPD